MRLLTFITAGKSRLGFELDGSVVDLEYALSLALTGTTKAAIAPPRTMIEMLQGGDPAFEAARLAEEHIRQRVAAGERPRFKYGSSVVYGADEVRLAAPIARPGKIICLGLNYADHIAESGHPAPSAPVLFAKFANSIIGPGDPVVLPRASAAVDYEVEMAFVIGKVARCVSLERAYEYVAGYMILNDVSARDLQSETSQWLRGKSPDTFAPTGPFLVTRDDVTDPQALDIKLWLNGELMQTSNTRHLIFDVPFLVHHITKTVTLEPGDIVSTGTPGGVGFARRPPVLLQPGDVMRLEVSGLGVLENPVVAEE